MVSSVALRCGPLAQAPSSRTGTKIVLTRGRMALARIESLVILKR